MIVRRFLAMAAPLAGVVGIVTACSAVPDVTFGDGDAGTATDGNGLPDTGGDSPADAATDRPGDVAVDPNCVPSGAEDGSCEDGLDNDCNGLVDCADPACNPTHECVDRAPVGFDLVAVADDRTTPCSAGFTDQRDVAMLVGADASCACTCTETGGTCRGGTANVTSSTDPSCTGGTTNTRALNRTQAACTAIPSGGLPIGNNTSRYELANVATQPSSCPSAATLTAPSELAGRLCTPPPTPGGGCASTQVCMRKPSAGYEICATRARPDGGASPTCATPYPTRRRAGASVTSTLTCDGAACSCNNAACTGTITVFENANCTGKSEPITPTGTCGPMALNGAGGAAFTALAYTATSTGGCTPAGNAPMQGSLEVTDESTICCKP